MLDPDVDFLDCFEAAASDGFKGIEYLFPYAHYSRAWAVPDTPDRLTT